MTRFVIQELKDYPGKATELATELMKLAPKHGGGFTMTLADLDITIERTDRRKTVSIFIERNGSVKVLAITASDEKVEAVQSREYQILQSWLNGKNSIRAR